VRKGARRVADQNLGVGELQGLSLLM
jgi:hypothetical protein